MKRRRRELRDRCSACSAPSAVILGMFVVYPLGARRPTRASAVAMRRGKRCRRSGWGQYVDVFRSNEFQHALANTARLALMTVPVGLALGIGLAVLADKQIRGIGFFRTVFSSTVATSVAVACWCGSSSCSPKSACSPISPRDLPVAEAPGLLHDPRHGAARAVGLSSIWATLGSRSSS